MALDFPEFTYETPDGKELSEGEKALIAANLQALVTTLDHLNVKRIEASPKHSKIGARVVRLPEKK